MSEPEKTPSEKVARAAMIGGGLVAALAGHHVEAGLAIGAAESTAIAAGTIERHVRGFADRLIAKTARRVKERSEQEQLQPDAETMDYFFREAIPTIGAATTEQKRQMMEEVILNLGRKSTEIGAQIEASEALKWITEMPDEAALVFSVVVAKIRALPPGSPKRLTRPLPTAGLPDFLVRRAEEYLKGSFRSTHRMGISIEERSPLIKILTHADQQGGQHETGEYELSKMGAWLGRWIADHPVNGEATKTQ